MRALMVGDGRMGSAVASEWEGRGHTVASRVGCGDAWPDEPEVDVAFEFTEPGSAEANVLRLLELGIPAVCGTTGWDPGPARRRADASHAPLLVASNFSPAVAALRRAAVAACRTLAPMAGVEAAVLERHHRGKADAPSGTAADLARLLADEGHDPTDVVSVRQGDQPGVHEVVLEGGDEELSLVHRARSLRPFAAGAAAAGAWLAVERPAGFRSFEDFLDGRQ